MGFGGSETVTVDYSSVKRLTSSMNECYYENISLILLCILFSLC